MPRNGSGTYSLPAGNPVVTGTTISSTVHNNTMTDIGSEITNSLDKDGQTVVAGTIDFNANKIVLDGDGDTSITSSTDDVIDIEVEGVDAVKIGWQSVADTGFITVDPKAFTADATENTHRLAVLNANAITIPTGTTALATSLYVAEPNITATGTLTEAATVYIAGAPSEGASNYSLFVDSGNVRFDGDLDVAGTILVETAVDERIQVYNNSSGTESLARIVSNASNPALELRSDLLNTFEFRASGSTLYIGDAADANADQISIASDQATRFPTTVNFEDYSSGGADSGTRINPDGSIYTSTTLTTAHVHRRFSNPNGTVGTISTTGSATAYNTSSDPRLKSDFTPITGALDMIVEAREMGAIGEFTFLADETQKVWGYNAHKLIDAQEGFGGTEGEGSRSAQLGDDVTPAGVDQSKRVPILEAAIGELLDRIAVLEALANPS